MNQKLHLRLSVVAAALAALFAGGAQAQSAPAADKPAEAVAATPLYSIGGFDLTGHIDIGYGYLSGSGKFVSGVNDRVFDFKHNTAYFHSLDLQLAKLPDDGWGGLVDITIGKDADTIAAYGTINKDKGPANGTHHYVDPTQVYVHLGAAPFSIIAGKFITSAGAEVIKSVGNVNYSRSILFGYAIPFTHTGVRATYKATDTLTLMGGVNQGWDAVEDPNRDKSIEIGGTFAPSKAVTLVAAIHSGKERVTNYPRSDANGMRNLVDLVATFNVNDQLTLIANYDYATQQQGAFDGGKAKWQGIAGYANYQFNDQWRLSLRGEYFDDRDGYRTGVAQKWKEATLTLAYMPSSEWEIRAEARVDKSDKLAFFRADGVSPTDTQHSFGLEALYKF